MADSRERAAYDSGQGWRWASGLSLVAAAICFAGVLEVRSTPTNGDWVTGAINFFAALALLGITSLLGVIFGTLEMARPSEQRHRWCGAALWANLGFILLVVSWLMVTGPG